MSGLFKNIFGKNETSIDNSATARETLRKPDLPSGPKGATALRQEEASSAPDAWVGKIVPVFQAGDLIFDTYEVKEVKSGGMGNVYIVQNTYDKQMLAIKAPNQMMLSHPDYFARVLREADAWIDLGVHPHIAFCYYIQKIEEVPHVFIEYVDGGNLEEWIADLRCDDLKVSLDMAIQCCHGMEHAHQHGLIHRDIKPKNILVTREGILKITDFGITRKDDTNDSGKSQGQAIWSKSLTSIAAMGTYDYMPPEQFDNPHTVDARADIFAFGVCMYEMCCGRRPYDETSIEAKAKGTSSWEPVKLREDIPVEVADLLKRCVALKKENRYSSFTELRDELTRIYQVLFQITPPHATIKVTEMRADVMNNRGVSYWHLGQIEQARQCWEEALQVDPQHLELNVNIGQLLLDKNELTDLGFLNILKDLESNKPELPQQYWQYRAWFCLNMDLVNETEKIQDSKYLSADQKYQKYLKLAKASLIRVLAGHTDVVSAIRISIDGKYLLSGSWDKSIRLWDLISGKELRSFHGHNDQIKSVCFSPDGKYLLSGSQDQTLRLWEVASGREIRVFLGHTSDVNSVCFSPDGRYALSGAGDIGMDEKHLIRLWEIDNGKEVKTFQGHTHYVNSVCFSPDGRNILSGSWDKTLRLWDVTSGKEIRQFQGHTNIITSVCFSPDGRYLLSGSWDQTIRLWDALTGRELQVYRGHTGWVNSVCFSFDSRYFLSGSNDCTLRLWEIGRSNEIRVFRSNGWIQSVCFSADGRYAISGKSDNTISIYEITYENPNQWQPYLSRLQSLGVLNEAEQEFQELFHQAQAVAKSNDKLQIYLILRKAQYLQGYERDERLLEFLNVYGRKNGGKMIGLHDTWLKRNYTCNTNKDENESIQSVCFSPDGRYVLSYNRILQLREIASGNIIRTFQSHTAWDNHICFSPDGQYVLSASRDNTLHLWDVKSGNELRVFQGHTNYVNCVCVSPDGKFVLSGSLDKTIRIWELASGKEIWVFQGHSYEVNSVSFSDDGQYVLSGSKDETLRLWNLSNGKEERVFHGHAGSVYSVCFSHDHRYALSGSHDQTLRLWEIKSGKEIRVFHGHTNIVNTVCLSQDDRYALSGSGGGFGNKDDTVRLWDIENGKEVRIFQGHTGCVNSVCFSPDDRYALSGSGDGTIKLWEFDWEWEFPT